MEKYTFKIDPFKGTDLLKLGLSSEEYFEIIGKKPDKFIRNEFSKGYTEDYDFCHIEYDSNGKSKSLMIFRPNKVTLNDFVLMEENTEPSDVKRFLTSIDTDCIVESSSIESPKYGIYIYICEGYIDSVTIYSK